MKDLTLVIMAAGMGSRFGGLKQIEPVGPNGEFIIDYSIYDAIRVGFTKIVFIIKEENYELFRETVGKRVEKHIKTEYAFQDINNIPDNVVVPKDREKPWGTGHAILSAKKYVEGDFAVINADDFYGLESYQDLAEFFQNKTNDEYLIVGYELINTLSDQGSTKRGICEITKEGYLISVIESIVERKNNKIIATPLSGAEPFEVDEKRMTAVNMFGFTKSLMDFLENDIKIFFENNQDNLLGCEYLIPDVLLTMVQKNIIKIKVIPTTAIWQGITYKEDKEKLVKEINQLIEAGKYPKDLWR